ncbi:MAG TPA: glycosyltransferase family 4 protein [Pyrinomonadaceae bacterium]|nr:glycosyltransferase family 4 protein [Pyrinomonadaceae bacterium]
MAADRKKILFITPGAQSFGGNIFLLNFLRWYKKNGGQEFVTLYGHPGDLTKDFAELSRTYRYFSSEDTDSFARKAAGKLANQLELRRAFLRTRIGRENIGLIYSNAVTNSRMLSMFDHLDVPVISHCHELESLIRLTGIDEFDSLRDRTSHFVAVSGAVRQNLISNHEVPNEKISLIHAFTPIENFSAIEIQTKRATVLQELALPGDAFIVGGSGTLNWRKAPELFVQIARDVKQRASDAPIYFVWVGGASENDFRLFQLNYDAERLGVRSHVKFLEHKNNPVDYFAAIDVFAMVSREDPYPLVCLEAASVGKPIICFADAGGMPEFVEGDCGYVVPYLDNVAFAEKIIELYADREKTKRLGENAVRKVRARHDIEVAAPAVADLIDRYLPR